MKPVHSLKTDYRALDTLAGIDNPAESRAIWQEAWRSCNKQIGARILGLRLMVLCIVVFVVMVLAAVFDGKAAWLADSWVFGALCAGASGIAAEIAIRPYRRKALRDLLRSEGRCANCGYKLVPPSESCPECGASSE